jgi:hypothetical protein
VDHDVTFRVEPLAHPPGEVLVTCGLADALLVEGIADR